MTATSFTHILQHVWLINSSRCPVNLWVSSFWLLDMWELPLKFRIAKFPLTSSGNEYKEGVQQAQTAATNVTWGFGLFLKKHSVLVALHWSVSCIPNWRLDHSSCMLPARKIGFHFLSWTNIRFNGTSLRILSHLGLDVKTLDQQSPVHFMPGHRVTQPALLKLIWLTVITYLDSQSQNPLDSCSIVHFACVPKCDSVESWGESVVSVLQPHI